MISEYEEYLVRFSLDGGKMVTYILNRAEYYDMLMIPDPLSELDVPIRNVE